MKRLLGALVAPEQRQKLLSEAAVPPARTRG